MFQCRFQCTSHQVTFWKNYGALFCDMVSLIISGHSQPLLLSWHLGCLVWLELPSVVHKLLARSGCILVVDQVQAQTVSKWYLNSACMYLLNKNELYRSQINVSASAPHASINGCQPYLHTLGENDLWQNIKTSLVKNSSHEQSQQNVKKVSFKKRHSNHTDSHFLTPKTSTSTPHCFGLSKPTSSDLHQHRVH